MLKQTALAATAASLLGTVVMAEPLERFDVAEDHTRFVFAPAPVHGDGLPAYGNPFVTQGYIYEAGTLDGGHEGVNPEGTPVFPERVIGTWTCDGWYVGDGVHTTSGTIIISRQVFQFEDDDVIISQGAELAARLPSSSPRGRRRSPSPPPTRALTASPTSTAWKAIGST